MQEAEKLKADREYELELKELDIKNQAVKTKKES